MYVDLYSYNITVTHWERQAVTQLVVVLRKSSLNLGRLVKSSTLFQYFKTLKRHPEYIRRPTYIASITALTICGLIIYLWGADGRRMSFIFIFFFHFNFYSFWVLSIGRSTCVLEKANLYMNTRTIQMDCRVNNEQVQHEIWQAL